MKSLTEQLKQRQVFKVATIYAVSAWPLIQIADLSVPALGLPDSFMTLLLIIFISGFPVSLVFAWLFNFTESGIVWASKDLHQKSSPQTNLQTTLAIVGSLLIVFIATAGSQLYFEKDLDDIEFSTEPTNSTTTTQEIKKESIAILPFIAFSNDPEDEFFADGMVEELLNLLAKIPKLQVTARTSSFAYKGVSNKTITEIGKELGVDTILEGSIRKSDTTNQIRVTAQLIKVSTGEHLWSETYNREYKNIFQIQDDIATSVVKKMTATLLGQSSQHQFIAETTNVNAMIENGKGQNELSHRTSASITKALKHFQHAINLDNQYARAYVGIADANILLTLYGNLDKKTASKNATQAINKALEIDENLAAAYASKGLLLSAMDKQKAEASFKKALQLNSNYAMTYMWYGSLLKEKGQLRAAHEHFEKALELDPKSSVAAFNVAWGFYEAGSEDKAMALFSQIIANDPYYPGAYNLVGKILFERGRLDESIEMYDRALAIDKNNKSALKGLIISTIDLGNIQAANLWLEYAKSNQEILSNNEIDFLTSRLYASQGKLSDAITLLSKIKFEHTEMGFNDYIQGEISFFEKDYSTAIMAFERLYQQKNRTPFYYMVKGQGVAHLAYAYKANGNDQKAEKIILEFESFLQEGMSKKTNNPSYFYNMTLLKSLQGKKGEAFYYLQGAIDVGWVSVWRAQAEPILTLLQKDTQFSQMMGGVKARLATMRAKMEVKDEFSFAEFHDL
ncbi:tetratricopeptide repeat protein [Pseudoalteromonas denitrificans]|uniref:TolB amino-terminal domain-containing protein n=1 Tax=Pseudoalteromonas denitrificans DSM 6059 TaxID=1123010 RepID=A0A1I1PP15_9GAMM|nr:tetratricopeptide repeat protein [Pseudoalteromonas denitrificans]SFD11407.1 TolB amino-terminal domain-containing protein [Pseudoalteromonas denitrificans DSM 6059]